jgi:hypothetical protein
MRRLWLHRYSLLSIALACANLFIVFAGTSDWYLEARLVPHTEPYRRLALATLVLAFASFGFGGMAVAKEEPKTFALAVVVASVLSFFICGFRMAV